MSQESDVGQNDEEYDYDYDDNVSEDFDDSNSAGVSSSTPESVRKNWDIKVQTGNPHKVVDFDEIVVTSDQRVSEISSLLEVDRNVAQILLQSFNWNREKIMESYFSDSDKLMSSTGVNLYCREHVSAFFVRDTVNTTENKSFLCKVCYDQFDNEQRDGFSLGCGHTFCKDCFGEYLKGQVNDGQLCINAHCPEHKCNQTITKDVYYYFLSTELRNKYDYYVARHFVENARNMRFCPAANCDKIVICSDGYNRTVTCSCSNVMCFKCGEEAHEPASCAQLQTWNEKCASDGESSKWIFANTKKCPKCFARIEKNQGCLHMVCRQCHHNFCWVCMGTHHVWVCNEFKPTVDESTELNAQQKAKVELERYHHFFNRYHNHDQALKFAAKQRTEAVRKMKEMQDKQADAWIDVQYVQDAVETVVQCRRVLKYTYVVGYYLDENSSEKLLFERHQEMLEENTERLHECTEGTNVFSADRTQVVNWTRITEKFRQSLLDSYVDGVSASNTFDDSTVSLAEIHDWLKPSQNTSKSDDVTEEKAKKKSAAPVPAAAVKTGGKKGNKKEVVDLTK